jgi:ferredoxin
VPVKIVVDRVRCTGLGLCEAAAPESFEIDEDGELVVLADEVAPERLEAVRAAVNGCPTEALRLVEG